MTTLYDVGDERRLAAAFTDLAGDAADPSTVRFTIEEPDGTVTEYVYGTDAELVKASTGNYYVDWPIAQAGYHSWRMAGTGTAAAAEEASFTARHRKTGAPA